MERLGESQNLQQSREPCPENRPKPQEAGQPQAGHRSSLVSVTVAATAAVTPGPPVLLVLAKKFLNFPFLCRTLSVRALGLEGEQAQGSCAF